MFAVVIEIDMRGVEQDAALAALREQTVPAIASHAGFQSGTWLMGNGFGNGLALTLWDTLAHAQAMTHDIGLDHHLVEGASIVRAEVREVAATA
jgi:hypothetical protein